VTQRRREEHGLFLFSAEIGEKQEKARKEIDEGNGGVSCFKFSVQSLLQKFQCVFYNFERKPEKKRS
jgi:hypothetical protein